MTRFGLEGIHSTRLPRPTIWIRAPGPVAERLRIGLLGGSFNPAHQGHLHVSDVALKKLNLDYIWWLVSPRNPLKSEAEMADLSDRLATAKAVAGRPRIVVTPIEVEFGTRYTADTILRLKRRFPGVCFVWLMGSDNLVQISRWKRWRAIFRMLPIAVVTRPGTTLAARCSTAIRTFPDAETPASGGFAFRQPPAWTILEARQNPLSATGIRSRRTE